MKHIYRFVTIIMCGSLILMSLGYSKKINTRTATMHDKTVWEITPSFMYDVLCFLNTLTGDEYYLQYYQDEYDKFKPQLTPAAETALTNLKRIIKDENQGIISAFLCLYFSATENATLDDMIKTLENSENMKNNLKLTPYYSEGSWQLYESVRDDLKTIFLYLQGIQFHDYWQENILPGLRMKIAIIEKDLPKYNVIVEDEKVLGFALPSDKIVVYMLYYSQPHGIKITGTRFLTDVAWPFEIVLRNAVHEMMHPPYDLANDDELRNTLNVLKEDDFLMDKILNHNPAYGYNSFEGFIEEDCVQALEQMVNERLGIEKDAHQRWLDNDDGMHVFAVVLYNVMKDEQYNCRGECFRDFLIRIIRAGRISPGNIQKIYNTFYQTR